MRIRTLFVILFIFLILFSLRYDCSYASDEYLSKATSLSFIKYFSIVHAERSFRYQTISIGISIDSSLNYKGNIVLHSKSSYNYAEKGKTASLKIEASNFVSSVELNLNTAVSISYGIGSIDVPVIIMNLEHSILDRMGESQEIILGEYLLFSGTVPVLGIQISLFMIPIIEYTPTLQGGLNIVGPAVASPSNLNWNQDSVSTSISFTDTEPVSISLSNPRLIINNFKMNLKIYAIIIATTISAPDIELVNLGDYSISSSTVNLISYDPNYFALYMELQQLNLELASRLQEVQQSIITLTAEINNLETTVTNMEEEISLIDSKVESYINELDNITTKYDELNNSIAMLSQRVTSLEYQVNQLMSQPSDQQFYINIVYGISIIILILVFCLGIFIKKPRGS